MELLTALKENWAVVVAAPLAFVIAVAIAAIIIWGAMEWAYRTSQNKAKERLEERDERISTLKEKATEREDRIKALEAQVKDQEGQINTLKAKCGDRDAQVTNLTSELQRVQSELEEANSKSIAVEFVDRPKAGTWAPQKIKLIDMQERLEPRRLTNSQRVKLVNRLRGLGKFAKVATAMKAEDGGLYSDDLVRAFAAAGWDVDAATLYGGPRSKFGLSLAVENPTQLTAIQTAIFAAFHDSGIEIDLAKGGEGVDAEIQIGVRQD